MTKDEILKLLKDKFAEHLQYLYSVACRCPGADKWSCCCYNRSCWQRTERNCCFTQQMVRATGDVIPESRGANQTSSRPKYAFIINYHLCKMIQEPLPENPGSSEARDSPDNSLGDAVNIKHSMGLGSFSIMHKSFWTELGYAVAEANLVFPAVCVLPSPAARQWYGGQRFRTLPRSPDVSRWWKILRDIKQRFVLQDF